MGDLDWVGLAAGVGFGIMGLMLISKQIQKAGNANVSRNEQVNLRKL